MFFFFSSRRRHTRYIGDWSSDVCSSDLRPRNRRLILLGGSRRFLGRRLRRLGPRCGPLGFLARSEERRVGKECRLGLWPHHTQEKTFQYKNTHVGRNTANRTTNTVYTST